MENRWCAEQQFGNKRTVWGQFLSEGHNLWAINADGRHYGSQTKTCAYTQWLAPTFEWQQLRERKLNANVVLHVIRHRASLMTTLICALTERKGDVCGEGEVSILRQIACVARAGVVAALEGAHIALSHVKLTHSIFYVLKPISVDVTFRYISHFA